MISRSDLAKGCLHDVVGKLCRPAGPRTGLMFRARHGDLVSIGPEW